MVSLAELEKTVPNALYEKHKNDSRSALINL